MNLKRLIDQYEIADRAQYLQCIRSVITDAQDMSVIEILDFMIEVECMNESESKPKGFDRLYNYVNELFKSTTK